MNILKGLYSQDKLSLLKLNIRYGNEDINSYLFIPRRFQQEIKEEFSRGIGKEVKQENVSIELELNAVTRIEINDEESKMDIVRVLDKDTEVFKDEVYYLSRYKTTEDLYVDAPILEYCKGLDNISEDEKEYINLIDRGHYTINLARFLAEESQK